jgi:hypothetical protein
MIHDKSIAYGVGIGGAFEPLKGGHSLRPGPQFSEILRSNTMNTKHTFSLRLAAVAVAAVLGLASPAFASKNESHPESHAEGHDDHGKDSHPESHGQGTDDQSKTGHTESSGKGSDDSSKTGPTENHGSTPALYASLAGTVEPGARGEAKLKTKTRGSQFEVELKIPVPSASLAVANKIQAQEATLTLTLSRSGVPYAECDFDLKAFKRGKAGVGSAKYKIEIYDRRGVLQERSGLCDIDLATAGAQTGLPAIQSGDAAAVAIDTNGTVFLEGVF